MFVCFVFFLFVVSCCFLKSFQNFIKHFRQNTAVFQFILISAYILQHKLCWSRKAEEHCTHEAPGTAPQNVFSAILLPPPSSKSAYVVFTERLQATWE